MLQRLLISYIKSKTAHFFCIERSERWLHGCEGSFLIFVSFVWCNKNVQPISAVFLICAGEPLAGLCSAAPGSPRRYCWTTEGAGRRISRGLRAGRDWHRCGAAEWAEPTEGGEEECGNWGKFHGMSK